MKNRYIVLIIVASFTLILGVCVLTGLVHVNLTGWQDYAIAIAMFILWLLAVIATRSWI